MILLSMLLLLLPPLLSCICYHHNRCSFSGRVAEHGDHVSRKRVLLGAISVSSDMVIEGLKKTPAQFLHGIYPQGKQQRTPPKASPTQRLVSNLPRGVTINGVEVSAQYATCPDCTLIGIVALRYHDRLLADLRPAYCRPMIDPIS